MLFAKNSIRTGLSCVSCCAYDYIEITELVLQLFYNRFCSVHFAYTNCVNPDTPVFRIVTYDFTESLAPS